MCAHLPMCVCVCVGGKLSKNCLRFQRLPEQWEGRGGGCCSDGEPHVNESTSKLNISSELIKATMTPSLCTITHTRVFNTSSELVKHK